MEGKLERIPSLVGSIHILRRPNGLKLRESRIEDLLHIGLIGDLAVFERQRIDVAGNRLAAQWSLKGVYTRRGMVTASDQLSAVSS